MTTETALTDAQHRAMTFLRREGRACAGKNYGRDGSVRTIPAPVWRSLERRGLVIVTEAVGGGLFVSPADCADGVPHDKIIDGDE